MQLVVAIKGNAQFLFLRNPQKLGTSQVYITSFKKLQTKYIFHWLEVITEILSFLQILSAGKTTTQFF